MLSIIRGKFTYNSVSMKPYLICLFIYLFVFIAAEGQPAKTVLATPPVLGINKTAKLYPMFNQVADTLPTHFVVPIMASNYYTSTLGFFCKKEIQVEKALKFPVKFRLGSVAYTDQMEGKRSTGFK